MADGLTSLPEEIKRFSKTLNAYSPADKEAILNAALWAEKLHHGQKRLSGEAYIQHLISVAGILINLRMDADCIIAALLHDALEDTNLDRSELRTHFGKEVEQLVEGVTKISTLNSGDQLIQNAETIRKMLFAMVRDIRVILIKLADKMHNMNTIQYLQPDKASIYAKECLDIYAPLAGRLGISWIKNELEDLALKALKPDIYQQIRQSVSDRKSKREEYLHRIEKALYEIVKSENLSIKVETRAKHFYSIYKKVKRTGKKIDEIFDLLGIRVFCESEADCYTVFGLIHRLWVPIDGRFKDYIARPKDNNYQSLHTTVMGYDGKLVEIQIRTYTMHYTAEYGIAAHWLYKEGENIQKTKPEEIALVNKLKTWHGFQAEATEFLSNIKKEILKDTIYVFTPKGNVIQLPKGATPLDFAYHIHTEVGNHCYGASADGKILPLHKPLRNSQVVEIRTSNTAHPHEHWLKMVCTSRARTKIRSWLHKAAEAADTQDKLHKKPEPEIPAETLKQKTESKKSSEPHFDQSRLSIIVEGEKNLLVRFARCCNPSWGHPIIGFISRGRGIIVHRTDCANLTDINRNEERRIAVQWGLGDSLRSTRRFKINAKAQTDIFSEIEAAVKKYHGHLVDGRTENLNNDRIAAYCTLELEKETDFPAVLKSIRSIPSILNIAPY